MNFSQITRGFIGVVAVTTTFSFFSPAPGYATGGVSDEKTGTVPNAAQQSRTVTHEDDINVVKKRDNLKKLSSTSLPFITNDGQVDGSVAYYANTFGGTVFVTRSGEIVYALPSRKAPDENSSLALRRSERSAAGCITLRESFIESKKLEVRGQTRSNTQINYFLGKDQTNWRYGVPAYKSVSLGEIYDNIELVLKASGNNVEKLFYIEPGAKYQQIHISLEGADDIRVNTKGELEAVTSKGSVRFTRPVAYQDIEFKGKIQRQPIEAAYLVEKNHYGFEVGAYDPTKTLIIDPLLASTYLGGSDSDSISGLAFDSNDNVYVTGVTHSLNFPVSTGSYDNSYNGWADVFVAAFSNDLTTLNYATYLGGSNDDFGLTLNLDSANNIFLTGETQSPDFPTTPGAYDEVFNSGNEDAFVVVLPHDLSSISSATYLGGSGEDGGRSSGIGSNGSFYLAGNTSSSDFPATNGAFDVSINNDPGMPHLYDVFVAVFSGDLSTLSSATFIGGSDADGSRTLTLDSENNVYLTGSTNSFDFPSTSGAYDTSYNGGYDAFAVALSSDLSTLLGGTFLGGSGSDYGSSINLGSTGDVYLTGEVSSTDFPTTPNVLDTDVDGMNDCFIAIFSNNLKSLKRATVLGGSEMDFGCASAIDSTNNIYLTGMTNSTDYPTTVNGYDTSYNGSISDGFAAAVSADLKVLRYSSFLGGDQSDWSGTIDLDSAENPFISMRTLSTDFPTTAGAYDTAYSADYDATLSKLQMKPDQFLCYKVKPTKYSPHFKPLVSPLANWYEDKIFNVNKMISLCNPAHHSLETIADPDSHLVGYKIKKAKGEPEYIKQKNVKIWNWFGSLILNLKKPDRLLVPSAKNLETPVDPLSPGDLDRYTCYDMVVKKKVCQDDPSLKCKKDTDCPSGRCNKGFPAKVKTYVVDQFNQGGFFKLIKPSRYCIPVLSLGGGVFYSDSLMCYKVQRAKKEPQHSKVKGIYINNQFSTLPGQLEPGENWQINTVVENELCVYSQQE